MLLIRISNIYFFGAEASLEGSFAGSAALGPHPRKANLPQTMCDLWCEML